MIYIKRKDWISVQGIETKIDETWSIKSWYDQIMRDAIRKSTFPNGKKHVIPKKKKRKTIVILFFYYHALIKNSPQITAKKKTKPAKISCFDFPDSYSSLVFNHNSVNSQQCYTYLWIYLVGVNTTLSNKLIIFKKNKLG